MESGSAPAAIRLAAAPRGFPGTGLVYAYIRCTDPSHLTSRIATASTGSLVPDSVAAPTTTAAPGLTVLRAASLAILVSVVLGLSYVTVSPCTACVNIL